MARLQFNGLDAVIGELGRLEVIGTDEEAERILNAMADAIEPVMKRNARKEIIGIRDSWTGTTQESVGRTKMKRLKNGGHAMYLYPQGERVRGKKKKRQTRNAEIGFYNEYGVPSRKMAARRWVSKSVEEAEGLAEEAVVREIERLIKD